MTERRRILQRATSLREIDEILGAMKSLAFVEVHRITTFIEAQRQAVGVIETAVADFLTSYGAHLPPGETAGDIVCLLGAERGLCGDFNGRLLEAAAEHGSVFATAKRIMVVGKRLADAYGAEDHDILEGPSVVEEVPAVITRLLERLTAAFLQQVDQAQAPGLLLLYQGAEGVRLRRLLPFTRSPVAAPQHAFPLQLQLAPKDLFQAMVEHYLYGVLHAVFYESLLEENRQRLEHMQRARDKLSETLSDLDRHQRKLRQEEITEEIELILHSAGAATR
jgi:F-type H+-transporting ATPase subunit gamma